MNEKEFWKEMASVCNDKSLENFKNIKWDKTWTLTEKTNFDDSFYISEKK